jgi:hypothetical protein
MKGHLCVLALIAVLLSTGCFGGGDNFNDSTAVASSKESAQQIALEISSENLAAASRYIHDNFLLDPAVAQKFNVGEFEGQGPDAFLEFFQRVLDKYGNVELQIAVVWSETEGGQVLLHTLVEFSGNNGNSQPHEELSFVENDLLTFQWNGTLYALIGWEEDPNPNPPPHNEGGGGGF